MLKLFRYVALIEGVTTLALFLIAMPLKYGFDYPALIRPVGMAHGIAFLAYVAAMLFALPGKGFSLLGAADICGIAHTVRHVSQRSLYPAA